MAEKDVNVKVVLHAPGSNPPFHFESNDLPIGNKDVIYFSNCGKFKGFRVHYELDNSKNPTFLFPTQQTNGPDHLGMALWVEQSSSCPNHACKWDVFEAKNVTNGGLTLIVKNTNEDVAEFFYTLRLTNGTDWLDLDPGGMNQNGGIPLFSANAILLGGAGLVTGALIGTYAIAPALC